MPSRIALIFLEMCCAYYSIHIFSLFNKDKRYRLKTGNIQIESLRSVPVKTIEQQKEFINLRYPKIGKIKITWKSTYYFLLNMLKFIVAYRTFWYLFERVLINKMEWFNFYYAIAFLFCFPVMLNFILRRFGLEGNDFTVFFRKSGGRRV